MWRVTDAQARSSFPLKCAQAAQVPPCSSDKAPIRNGVPSAGTGLSPTRSRFSSPAAGDAGGITRSVRPPHGSSFTKADPSAPLQPAEAAYQVCASIGWARRSSAPFGPVTEAEDEVTLLDDEPVAGGLGGRPRAQQALADQLGRSGIEHHTETQLRVRPQLLIRIVHLDVRADRAPEEAGRVLAVHVRGVLLLQEPRRIRAVVSVPQLHELRLVLAYVLTADVERDRLARARR